MRRIVFFHSPIIAGILAVGVAATALAQKPLDLVRDEEYRELAGQIERRKAAPAAWRERLAAESLDRQALILPGDRDPLDVVLRRTAALVEYCQQRRWLSAPAAGGASTRSWPDSVRRERRHRPTTPGGTLFIRVCELRRQRRLGQSAAWTSTRSSACWSSRARRGSSSRRGPSGRDTAAGGGPLIVRNFKTQPELVKPLDGVKVAAGAVAGPGADGQVLRPGTELRRPAIALRRDHRHRGLAALPLRSGRAGAWCN